MNDTPTSPTSNAEAQIVEKLKSATNILVAISANPTIDQLSACIATTLLLNKYKKNATAVFSGKIPTFLNFLKPKENIEKTVDSLRDFIIALDKSKADKLRYKVEDDVVKIFITPYRTSITEKDLKYSAGEFNVDVILALGVQHQQDLDKAITAHGRIFHDAVVVSINNRPGGDFGIANWEVLDSSSLSELIANLAQQLDSSLLDAEIATALLTGIVAETSRFSNNKTHPSTMNISSMLLEAGADQQLVNTQLQDLIGTVVNLAAGTEIKPTVSKPEVDQDHTDVTEELVIDEHGAFNQINDSPSLEQPVVAPKVQPVVDLELPNVSSVATAPSGQLDDPSSMVESLLGASVEPTPTPMLDTEPSSLPGNEIQPPAGSSVVADQTDSTSPVADDAETARQAVESALSDSGADSSGAAEAVAAGLAEANATEALPNVSGDTLTNPPYNPSVTSVEQPSFDNQPPLTAQANPLIQPIMPNQPSYANPATTTEYALPAVPEHEPAPLGMSPADQAFTMPMPPVGSMPAPAIDLQLPPDSQSPLGTPPPPPLPPPMTPPSFGGSGR